MNSGSPVESRYVQPAATAARTAGAPHFANGPTVETSTSPAPTRSKTVFWRIASARTYSRPPRRSASAASARLGAPGEHGPRALGDQALGDQPPV